MNDKPIKIRIPTPPTGGPHTTPKGKKGYKRKPKHPKKGGKDE